MSCKVRRQSCPLTWYHPKRSSLGLSTRDITTANLVTKAKGPPLMDPGSPGFLLAFHLPQIVPERLAVYLSTCLETHSLPHNQ